MIRTVIRCMQPFMLNYCQRAHKNGNIMKRMKDGCQSIGRCEMEQGMYWKDNNKIQMRCFVQCVKMPINLSFLQYLQITSKYLCVFGGDDWSVAEGIYSHIPMYDCAYWYKSAHVYVTRTVISCMHLISSCLRRNTRGSTRESSMLRCRGLETCMNKQKRL